MRKTDLINLLRDADEETAVQISEQYPPFSDADSERIFRRIEQQVKMQQELPEEPLVIRQAPRFAWMRRSAAAAACLLMLCGTFAGIFAMKRLLPEPPERTEVTESTSNDTLSHAVGERYAAVNLTQSGTLWLTVEEAGMMQDGMYHVRITLESENAVSHAESRPEVFMADNLMIAVGRNGDLWETIQPRGIRTDGAQNAHPYAVTLHSGETMELELWYQLDNTSAASMFVTSYCTKYPYTELKDKEN